MQRPRVALLRGVYLGNFEAQNYEPLLEQFDIRGYVLPQNLFDLNGCRIPVSVCCFPDAFLFRGRSLINAWCSRVLRQRYPMPHVDGIVGRSQIVHTFEAWYTHTLQAARACRKSGIPLVITHWDTLPYSRLTDARMRAEIDYGLDVASKIIATTDVARQVLLAEGVSAAKIIVQGMGVDTDRFSPGERDPELARRLGISADDFVFSFLGRLVPEKGIRELLAAFRGLCLRYPTGSLKLLFVGKGPEEGWVQTQMIAGGLKDKVILAPPVAYSQLHRWHRLADVFVFPSIPSSTVEEQFGYALIEAMACGRAIVSTRTGGIPEVVQDCAIIVPPADVEALTEAMLQLRDDPQGRVRLGGLARKRAVERYSSRLVATRLIQVYNEVLQE